MINILRSNKDFDKKERYMMTLNPSIVKMSDFVDDEIEVKNYCIFEDKKEDSDQVVTICSVMDQLGTVYATNSATFRKNFEDIADIFDDGEPFTIEIKRGTSKNGRTYIYCGLK